MGLSFYLVIKQPSLQGYFVENLAIDYLGDKIRPKRWDLRVGALLRSELNAGIDQALDAVLGSHLAYPLRRRCS